MAAKRASGSKSGDMTIGDVMGLLEAAGAPSSDVCVVVGPEGALRRLVVDQLLGARSGGTVVVRISATDKGAVARIDDAAQPSLFGGSPWVHIMDLESVVGDDVRAAVGRAMPAAGPDLRIVLEHGGGTQGIGVVRDAERAGAARFDARPVAVSALPQLLAGYAHDHGAVLGPVAAAAMIDILGNDVTGLFGAARQMASDTATGTIGEELVRDTLIGSGVGDMWQLADLVWAKDTAAALVLFRRLVEQEGRGVGVVVVVALTRGLRAIVKCVDGPPPGNQWQVASALGVPGWKVPQMVARAALWDEAGVAAAAARLADADAAVKGGMGRGAALDDEQKLFALEKLIIELTTENRS